MKIKLYLVYNYFLLILGLEELIATLVSIFDRPLANILLQIYPSLILFGNIQLLLNFLRCDMYFFWIYRFEMDVILQIFYLSVIFIINLFNMILLDEKKAFENNNKLLFLNEKIKLIYINGYFGSIVNLVSIIYLVIYKTKERFIIQKLEYSLNA